MNTYQIRTIAYGITLGSLTLFSFNLNNSTKTVAASTEQGSLALVANGEDFVRQGFISKDGWKISFDYPGTVEMTLHFDRLFGDADTPAEDALNQDALGFQPLANLASNDKIELESDDLAAQLSPEAIAGLGHVGEGHFVVTNTQ